MPLFWCIYSLLLSIQHVALFFFFFYSFSDALRVFCWYVVVIIIGKSSLTRRHWWWRWWLLPEHLSCVPLRLIHYCITISHASIMNLNSFIPYRPNKRKAQRNYTVDKVFQHRTGCVSFFSFFFFAFVESICFVQLLTHYCIYYGIIVHWNCFYRCFKLCALLNLSRIDFAFILLPFSMDTALFFLLPSHLKLFKTIFNGI